MPAVDVVVYEDQFSVIPEVGIGGYTPAANRTFLAIDTYHQNFETGFQFAFLSLLAHELHHCTRWAGPGYGKTLGEALISEGLACMFESELPGGKLPFYAQALSSDELRAVRKLANAELNNSAYDHARWFYGSVAEELPRHAGYSLGYTLVLDYIEAKGGNAAKLAKAPAARFYRKS